MTKRRPITQLPAVHRTNALERFFGSTVDHLFQPGRAEPLSGYIGRVPSYNDLSKDFYIQEPTEARTKYQLEAAMVSYLAGEYGAILTYEDLIARLSASGALVSNPDRLFQSEFWSWAPPVDIDKINNFQQYYWSGDDVPALTLTLPGMEIPAIYYAAGDTKHFKMPNSLKCWRLLPETEIEIDGVVQDFSPAVLLNGDAVSFTIDAEKEEIILSTLPDEGDVVEIYRYGNVSNGTRTEYAIPFAFSDNYVFNEEDVHVYVRGREIHEFSIVDETRIALDSPAANGHLVTVTLFDSIQTLCTGKATFNIENLNTEGVEQMINGLKVKLIDPSVFFLGFDVKAYDTFKWDERRPSVFYVDGVGSSIKLTDASVLRGLEPQYVVMSRMDSAASYFTRINRWVTVEALEWFNGKSYSRQAKRPICEYIENLELWNYGKTRAPDADCFFGVINNYVPRPFTTIPFLDDTGRAVAAGDVVLFGDIGDPDYNNKFFIWPAIDEFTSEIELEFLYEAIEDDVVSYTASSDEYRLSGSNWVECQKLGDFPLFDLFDNDGYSIGDEGIYPNSNFSGSRIFCYEVGVGDADPILGFPVKHDTYGQIIFENELYTKTYSFRDGDIEGFYYYKVGNKFQNQWYKSSGLLPAAGSAPEIVVPLNLQSNPNFDTPKFISRNNWFAHFASIVTNQVGFEGKPYSDNNWSETEKNLGRGTSIIQSRAPLLKLMLLMSDNGFDLQRAITYAETEYVRLKLKIRQKINESVRNGTLTIDSDFDNAILTILKNLISNKTSDFSFFLSDIGGGSFFIPPTPATLNILPMITPKMITENQKNYILGHDGSKTASSDTITDGVILAFEKLIFNSRQNQAYHIEEFPLLNEYDLISGKYRQAAYNTDEVNIIQRASFEEWVRVNNADYQTNTTYDPENPFTWNYGSMSDVDGDPLPGHWRGIYRHYFDCEMPNMTPWEMLGFAEKPVWWKLRYGDAPYSRNNTTLWTDIENGYIAAGSRQGIDPRFARPGLMDVLPVDQSGNLLHPVEARIVEREPVLQFAQENWVFGDSGPIENLWRRSSSYSFSKTNAMFLMRPAQFVEYYWDTDNRALVHDDQWIDIPTNDRAAHSELMVHGELVNGIPKVSHGIQNWIVEYMISSGQSPELLGNFVRGLDVRLIHKMAGFTTPDRMAVSAESFGIIPSEDIAIELYQSPSLSVDVYSGIIIEYMNTSRWRVIGYNPIKPFFTIRPSDRGGKKKQLSRIVTDERVVNPWLANSYYTIGSFVSYKGTVYECLNSHLSSAVFEQKYWEADDFSVVNDEKLYRYTDWDGSVGDVPYATVFHSRQDLIDFVYGYQRDLEARGFVIADNEWDDAVLKFINWSKVEWATGSFITLSPGAREIEYNTPHGYVLNLEDTKNFGGIVNRTGHRIDERNTKADRYDSKLTITATSDEDIYGVSLRKAEVEHVLIFSNRTIFGDIIFDPVFNIRQDRLKMNARRTTEWNGRYDAPGFIISEGTILDNFEKSAEDIRYMFDIELADNTVLRDHARHTIGFERRPYLNNLLLNETQQFELYQGMIQQKGALSSLNKIMRSRAVEGNRDLRFMEEWAFKLGEFGAYEPRGYVELNIKQGDLRRQNQIIRLDRPVVNEWKEGNTYQVGEFVRFENVIYVVRTPHVAVAFSKDQELGYWSVDATNQASAHNAIINITDTDSKWVSNPLKFNDLIIDNADNYHGIPDAGYIRTNEAQYSSQNFEKFTEAAKSYLSNGGSYLAGECVWIYGRNFNGWSAEYLEYASDDITFQNLVSERLGNSQEWSATSTNGEVVSSFQLADHSTPDVIKNARYVSYVDGNGTVNKKDAALFSPIIPVIAGETYLIGMDAYVTRTFNGSVVIRVHWLDENGNQLSISSDSFDFSNNSAARDQSSAMSELIEAPTDAVNAQVQIRVQFPDTIGADGRAYVASPIFRYAGIGTTVSRVVTNAINSDVVGTRFYLNRDHNLEVGDFVLIGGPVRSNYDSTGIFEVTDIDTEWFEIDSDEATMSYDFDENDEVGPPVFYLKNARFKTITDAQSAALKGSLVFVDNVGDGTWGVFRSPDFNNAIRRQPLMVDNTKVASALVYDQNTLTSDSSIQPKPITLARINPVDPSLGVIIGVADREIDYKLEYDPAGYDTIDGLWTDEYVGRVWWDMSTTWFINPYTNILDENNPTSYLDELEYRSKNWAKLAPGVEVSLYEWTKSRVAPADYTDYEVYDINQYVEATEYDPYLGKDVEVYYFWIKNPDVTPAVDFRKTDLRTCASMITNPSLSNVPWIALISDKELVVSGLHDYLNETTSVIQVLLQLTDWDEDIPHVQWSLVRPEDPRSQPPQSLWNKLRDSLVGFDTNNMSLPYATLHNANRVGIETGQSMFSSDKYRLARESFVTMINYQLARRNFGNDQSFADDQLTFNTPISEDLNWVLLPGDTIIADIPPAIFYDAVTNDPAELLTLLETNDRVLLDNRFGDSPSWSVWEKSGSDIAIAKAYQHQVDYRADLSSLTIGDDERVLIKEDSQYEDMWTVSRYSQGSFEVVYAQTYRTSDFWERRDWYADGYDANNPPVVTYSTQLERNHAEQPFPTNSLVKILDNGAGYWIWTQYEDGVWRTVAQQLGTIQLSEKFYLNTAVYGMDGYDPTTILNRDGSHELRILFHALFANDILSAAEQNELWFAMINFIHAHHDLVDWAFKTSFLSIVGFNEALTAAPVTSPDTTADILSYVEEVKPYHVTVRDFARSFARREELPVSATDFDKPIYYDADIQQYRRLDPSNEADHAIMENGVWRHWLENTDLARRFKITMMLDRVWFEDTDDSGAARRITSFYQPRSDMTPLDLDKLLELDFKGTILDGKTLDDMPTEVTAYGDDGKQINGDTIGKQGFQMRDPRVAEDTPQELVRLGTHDLVLFKGKDKWGAGGPLSTVNVYNVENETADTISLRIDALARDVVLFFDGVRGERDVDFTFNQLGNQVENVLLSRNGSRAKSVIVHAFGYAGHSTIIDQAYMVTTTTGDQVLDIPQAALDTGDFSVEATVDGVYTQSAIVGDTVKAVVPAGKHLVFTFYKTAFPETTNMEIQVLPTKVSPITSDAFNDSSLISNASTYQKNHMFYDRPTNTLIVGDDDGSIMLHDFRDSSDTTHGADDYLLMNILEGCGVLVTQDTAFSDPSTNPKYRLLQFRSRDNLTVIGTMGTNGVYPTATASLEDGHIPEDITIMDLSNPLTEKGTLLLIRTGQAQICNVEGDILLETEDLEWDTDSFLVKTIITPDYVEAILVNPSSTTQPFVKITVFDNLNATFEPYELEGISALGSITVTGALYYTDEDSLILWGIGDGDFITKYSLTDNTFNWVTWSGNSYPETFHAPTHMAYSRLINDSRHMIWSSDLGAHRVDLSNGDISTLGFASNVTSLGGEFQIWDEVTHTLIVAESDIRLYHIDFVDAPFAASFTGLSHSLLTPYDSSMIVEEDGKRLSPRRMMHIYNSTEYFLGGNYVPADLRILDDAGTVETVTLYLDNDFDNIDEIYEANLTDRFILWRKNIVILDADARQRNYIVYVENTGDYYFQNGDLYITSYRSGKDYRVIHWNNDRVMQPVTWAFDPQSGGNYRFVTKARAATSWVTRGGIRLVEDVDYVIQPIAAGAWGVEGYDTFRYDDPTMFNLTIKNTTRGYESDPIVITTFEGPQAVPAQEWQHSSTTPSIFRFNKREMDVTGREYIREPLAWETATSDPRREGGKLTMALDTAGVITSITVEENAFDAPPIIFSHLPFMVPNAGTNTPGVFWIGAERFEYFKVVRANGTATFSQIRRGTRGTPVTNHAVGDVVTVQNVQRRIPPLPHGDISL